MRLAVLMAARHAVNGAHVQNIVNVILIIAAVVLGVIAAAKLCGANKLLPRAAWWQVGLAALILFIIWWLW